MELVPWQEKPFFGQRDIHGQFFLLSDRNIIGIEFEVVAEAVLYLD